MISPKRGLLVLKERPKSVGVGILAVLVGIVGTYSACSSTRSEPGSERAAIRGASAPGSNTNSGPDKARTKNPGRRGHASGVDLGMAGSYAILAKSGISSVPASNITGDIGVSPAAATYITGFSLILDPSGQFSTSTQVTGQVYAADYSDPTPAQLTTAVLNMQAAYTDAAGRAAGSTELGAGNIGGMTLPPGVYAWSSPLLIPSNLTLSGNHNAVWIFQVAQTLTLANATSVVMAGSARPENVYWQVAGAVSLGTTSHFEGNLLGATSIAVQTGASVNGRLLAQTAVTLESTTVVQP